MVKIKYPIDQVDASPQYTIGSRTMYRDPDIVNTGANRGSENEYEYRGGAASVVNRDVCVFNQATGSVARLTVGGTAGVGALGIAQGAIISSKYGWFGIKGIFWGNAGEQASSGSALYAGGTTATFFTTATAGEGIFGGATIGAGASNGGTVKVYINYPFITHESN